MAKIVTIKNSVTKETEYPITVRSAIFNDDGTLINIVDDSELDKVKIIAQPVAPDGIVEGRLWLDTTENASGTLVSQSLNIGTVGYIDNPVQSDFKGQAMITLSYDDGLTNSYKLGLPIHEKYGVPATFNITSGNLNDVDNIYMTKDQVKDLYHRGVEIASHGNVHSYVKRYTQLTDTEIRFECTESIRLLKEASGALSVDTMAIIYSDYDESVKPAVNMGYITFMVVDLYKDKLM